MATECPLVAVHSLEALTRSESLEKSRHMFRTFTQNPSLGGFGGDKNGAIEEATPDAFCQIIKELVDNAVDACCGCETGADATVNGEKGMQHRVRVTILDPCSDENKNDGNRETLDQAQQQVLRVTVTDNGCGMNDIAACVGAFHTSKAAATSKIASKQKDDPRIVQQTAGRYGIGLTLCLLHAQRLVPNSCASIQSAVRTNSHWTTMLVVVDANSDKVRCIPQERQKKGSPAESGTSVSILVPVSILVDDES